MIIDRIMNGIRTRYKYFYRSHAKESKYDKFVMDDWVSMGGKPFDIDSPETYCQKTQWVKIHDKDPRKCILTDKVKVREWVKDKIGEEYLIPIIGVYAKPEDIVFESLPEKCVIKMNHASHMNIIIKNKNEINKKKIIKQLKRWEKRNFAFPEMEMHYRNIKPQIIIEKYIEDSAGELKDYKFFCFSGVAHCLYVMGGRQEHDGLTMGILDRDFKLLPYSRKGVKMIKEQPRMPENYASMLAVAEKLSEGFPHVRVDMYDVDGTIYFGEMTFTSACGFGFYDQEEFDKELGDLWTIK